MPWNGLGTFNRLFSWTADAAAGIDIQPARVDADTNDIANGFNNVLTRDGQGFATANLPMATNRHTGIGNGVARTDYAALGQVQDGLINWAVASGTSDALIVTLSPALTALRSGQLIFVRSIAANLTNDPTLTVNGLPIGSAPIVRERSNDLGGDFLLPGDIPRANYEMVLRFHSGGAPGARWNLLNPALLEAGTGRTAVSDKNYQTAATDTIVAYTSLSAPRTVSLIAAASYQTARRLTVVDETGSAASHNITVARAGADTIIGATSYTISNNYGSVTLEGDGVSKWTATQKT